MALALMERRENEQVLAQYRICVYTKELFRISRWTTSTQDESLSEQLRRSQHYYKVAALTALKKVNFLYTPGLTLVQSLLSGVSDHSMRSPSPLEWNNFL